MTDATSEHQGAFSPAMVATINQAYEGAIADLGIRDAHSDRRAALARIIMDLARRGESNEAALRQRAVTATTRYEKISARAHEIWEAEGRPNGRHDDHWAQAEGDIG